MPATRAVGSLLNATPGLTVDNNGSKPTPTMTFFSARGGQTNEGRMTVNGMTVAAAFNGGGVSSYILDTVNVDEVSVAVSGGMGETDTGGPVMNLVPRAGGNRSAARRSTTTPATGRAATTSTTNCAPSASTRPPGIIKAYDAASSYGGPIKRDRLWFFGSYRKLNTETAVEGIVANANAGNLSRWDWVAGRQPPGTPDAGPHDVHRPRHGAGHAEAPHHLQPRVPAALRGRAAERRDRGLPHARRRLDCLRRGDDVARSRDQPTSTSRTT